MKRVSRGGWVVLALVVATALSACASKESDLDQVRAKLKKVLPDLKPENVRRAPAAGLYEVQDGSHFGYVTPDGKFLVAGDLIDLASGQSLTENSRRKLRTDSLAALGEQNMIIFAPETPAKHVVTVFTDVDCGYCRRLHSQINEFNAQGIEIRYVFYPRTGPHSESFHRAEEVWCSADRKTALTQAKLGMPLPETAACATPVQREWDLGNEFGLRGTPMLVLEDGSVINGYVTPAELARRLQSPQGAQAQPDRG